MASTTPIQFKADEALTAHLRARDPHGAQNPGVTARRGLTLWYEALHRALLGVSLEAAEILLLADVVQVWCEIAGCDPANLVEELPQAVRDNQAPGFDHVRAGLAERVEGWNPLERWAVVDYCERYSISLRLYGGTLAEVVARIERESGGEG